MQVGLVDKVLFLEVDIPFALVRLETLLFLVDGDYLVAEFSSKVVAVLYLVDGEFNPGLGL